MNDEAWTRLAGAVRSRRDELGLTQVELATKAGISEPTLRVIEGARRRSYQKATLRALSQALGWTPDGAQRILGGEDALEAGAQRTETETEVEALKAEVAKLQERIANLQRQR